jgi:hypothetical protein
MAKLPTVVSSLPQDLKAFINQVREALDGRNGDRLLTVDDLVRSGVASSGPGGTITPPPGVVATPITPKNVQASGAIQNIIVTWDDPLYNGHSHAEVWGSSTNSLGAAVRVGMTPGAIFVDAVGPSVNRYYWVRFVNVLGVVGAFNAVAGVLGQTGSDVAYLLSTLTGAITETQLFTSLNTRINLVDGSGAGSVNARIATETTNRTTADTALSSQITTVSSATTTNTAAIQSEVTTRASETGSLFAKYTVKVDVNGYVSGFGLASVANNGVTVSDFIIRADRFSVASPSGPGLTPVIPFIVNTTTQTINGVSVPAGIYMDAAFIKNGTITTAKIGNAQIDDAKIVSLTAAKITAGEISVGNYIQSSGFISGSQGWRIHGNGVAEFAAASIRGQLVAAQIDSRGLSIKDASGNIILAAGSPLATANISGLGALATQSSVSTGQVTGLGALATQSSVSTGQVTGLGTLATQNTVSTGQVTGLGTLATQNAVDWNTQLVNIPGFGNFAYLNTITSANISTYIAGAAIGTAYISNAAITNALIANGAITSAKIGDAEITSAKIGTAQVTTLKIGSEAVTIPRSATGTYTALVSFPNAEASNYIVLGTFTQGAGRGGININLKAQYGSTVYPLGQESPIAGTTGAMSNSIFLPAGLVTFFIDTASNVGDMRCTVTVLGAMR